MFTPILVDIIWWFKKSFRCSNIRDFAFLPFRDSNDRIFLAAKTPSSAPLTLPWCPSSLASWYQTCRSWWDCDYIHSHLRRCPHGHWSCRLCRAFRSSTFPARSGIHHTSRIFLISLSLELFMQFSFHLIQRDIYGDLQDRCDELVLLVRLHSGNTRCHVSSIDLYQIL